MFSFSEYRNCAALRLWIDDTRMPPDSSWFWARTLSDVLLHISSGVALVEASLDHDLEYAAIAPEIVARVSEDDDHLLVELIKSWGVYELDGLTCATIMTYFEFVPPLVRIHSQNPAGAASIVKHLRAHHAEIEVYLEPYDAEHPEPSRRPVSPGSDDA